MPRKITDRQRFLELLNWVIPWEKLVGIVEPFYPREEEPDKPAIPLIWMLKLYFLQMWFGLTDGQTEDMLLDSFAVQRFLGVDWGRHPLPNETAILEFRRLIDRHRLRPKLSQLVGESLERAGIRISPGKIVDALIIKPPDSLDKASDSLDPKQED